MMMVIGYKWIPTVEPRVFILDFVYKGKYYTATADITGKEHMQALLFVLGHVVGVFNQTTLTPEVVLGVIGFKVEKNDKPFPLIQKNPPG